MLACCDAVGGGDSEAISCAKPRMAFSGLRNSWLMLDRNSDFAWLATSAEAWACFSASMSVLDASHFTMLPSASFNGDPRSRCHR
ncbi:hypothetical protein D3C72_1922070 [compost metagenome]